MRSLFKKGTHTLFRPQQLQALNQAVCGDRGESSMFQKSDSCRGKILDPTENSDPSPKNVLEWSEAVLYILHLKTDRPETVTKRADPAKDRKYFKSARVTMWKIGDHLSIAYVHTKCIKSVECILTTMASIDLWSGALWVASPQFPQSPPPIGILG
ncbi:hypothetical protein UY3_11365 [Chelonia mydas]|uniref:Uncharacterized protein n=1 Tax=Chelonia mydas TaxID=8469 RepID=M7BTQ4_CHEMY|nr:hypothetical protein UY3_11365 [Chelonia mydas]